VRKKAVIKKVDMEERLKSLEKTVEEQQEMIMRLLASEKESVAATISYSPSSEFGQ